MSYAGDLSPDEAWAKLEAGAILVDVRTEGEWAHIGIPDTAAAGESRNDPLFIQWNLAGGTPNPHFVEQLRQQAPEDTAYAVWVGIGAALTVGWAMATGVEPASPLKLLFIAGIVGCAAGLKLLPPTADSEQPATYAVQPASPAETPHV